MKLIPKHWERFQHYKHRSPPWIKLHRDILDDYDWWCLPVASRAIAPCLWLLASCEENGEFDATPEKLAFRFRMSEKDITSAIKPLIDKGYFIVASDMIADSYQLATSEQSRAIVRVEKSKSSDSFEYFWKAYPKKVGKTDALKSWNKLNPDLREVLTALSWQIESDQWNKSNGQFIPNPATYLNQGRWQDEQPLEVIF